VRAGYDPKWTHADHKREHRGEDAAPTPRERKPGQRPKQGGGIDDVAAGEVAGCERPLLEHLKRRRPDDRLDDRVHGDRGDGGKH